MIEFLINKIVDYQIRNDSFQESERSVYQYGYTLLFEKGINVLLALVICLITGKWIEIPIFLLLIIPIRIYIGGWHAKKFIVCTIFSNLIIVGATFLEIFKTNVLFFSMIEIVLGGLIVLKAPVQHKNRKLTFGERNKYKTKSIIYWGVESLLACMFIYINELYYANLVIYVHVIIIIAMVLGEICAKDDELS